MKMSYKETMSELMQQTEKTEVYACRAYEYVNEKNQASIGIRRCIVGQKERDPIIDEVSFMLCGDIYSIYDYGKITILDELCEADNDNFCVRLRAVSGSWPIVTIDLGTYNILRKEIITSDIIKLNLKRR